MKYDSYIIHVDVNSTNVVERVEVAEYLQIFLIGLYYFPLGYYHSAILYRFFLQLAPISESDIFESCKSRSPFKSLCNKTN